MVKSVIKRFFKKLILVITWNSTKYIEARQLERIFTKYELLS